MAFTRSDLTTFLQEIRAFFGKDWFDAQCVNNCDMAAPEKIHLVVRWWTEAKAFLDSTRLHDLNTTPMQEVLYVVMFGSCLRTIAKGNVIDMRRNLSEKSPEDLFRRRLRSSEKFASAFYEMQVASAYIRNGYKVSFIDDETRKSPEFVVDVDRNSVYVECKRIERRSIDKASSDRMGKLCARVGLILLRTGKRLGVIIVCPNQKSSAGRWIEKHISRLIEHDQATTIENERNGFRFKISSLPPSEVIWAQQAHIQEMMNRGF
jgi:hypothetical protein